MTRSSSMVGVSTQMIESGAVDTEHRDESAPPKKKRVACAGPLGHAPDRDAPAILIHGSESGPSPPITGMSPPPELHPAKETANGAPKIHPAKITLKRLFGRPAHHKAPRRANARSQTQMRRQIPIAGKRRSSSPGTAGRQNGSSSAVRTCVVLAGRLVCIYLAGSF